MFRSLFGRARQRRHSPRPPLPCRLALEPLEDRTVPAVTFSITNRLLLVTGDATANAVTVDHNATTHMAHITANGAAQMMDFSDNRYDSIKVLSGAGASSLTLLANVKPLVYNGTVSGPHDLVSLGRAGNMSEIQASVALYNLNSYDDVTLDDSADPVGQSVTLRVEGSSEIDGFAVVEGLAPAAVRLREFDAGSLTIKGGPGGNTFLVQNTLHGAPAATTTIITGAGGDLVCVHATTDPLAVTLGVNAGLIVGNPDNRLSDIATAITVTGAGAGMGNYLYVVDVGNPNAETYAATDTSLSNAAHAIVNFSGIDYLGLWESSVAGTTLNDTHDVTLYTLEMRTDDPPMC